VTASINVNENKDNEAYVTSFDETGKTVVVEANFRDKYFKGRSNCCNKTDIFWEVFIPEKIDFSIETINANITINGQTEEMKIKSISGFIDLAVPASRKADIDFSTISGTIYSNLELSHGTNHNGIPSKITEKLNSGGSMIRLETISGDIFFRKSN
jgi:predicted membrane protein